MNTNDTSLSDHVIEAIKLLTRSRPTEIDFENRFADSRNFVRVNGRLSVDLYNKTTGNRINVYINDSARQVVVTKDEDGIDTVLVQRAFSFSCTAVDGQALVDAAVHFLDLVPSEFATLSK